MEQPDRLEEVKKEIGEMFEKAKRGEPIGVEPDSYKDPVEEYVRETQDAFTEMRKQLAALAPKKTELGDDTVEKLTGTKRGRKGKSKGRASGGATLPFDAPAYESASEAAAEALMGGRGLRGAAGAALRFKGTGIKNSFIDTFDPLRIVQRTTNSPFLTALAGKMMFRNPDSIRRIAGLSGGTPSFTGSNPGYTSPTREFYDTPDTTQGESESKLLLQILETLNNMGLTITEIRDDLSDILTLADKQHDADALAAARSGVRRPNRFAAGAGASLVRGSSGGDGFGFGDLATAAAGGGLAAFGKKLLMPALTAAAAAALWFNEEMFAAHNSILEGFNRAAKGISEYAKGVNESVERATGKSPTETKTQGKASEAPGEVEKAKTPIEEAIKASEETTKATESPTLEGEKVAGAKKTGMLAKSLEAVNTNKTVLKAIRGIAGVGTGLAVGETAFNIARGDTVEGAMNLLSLEAGVGGGAAGFAAAGPVGGFAGGMGATLATHKALDQVREIMAKMYGEQFNEGKPLDPDKDPSAEQKVKKAGFESVNAWKANAIKKISSGEWFNNPIAALTATGVRGNMFIAEAAKDPLAAAGKAAGAFVPSFVSEGWNMFKKATGIEEKGWGGAPSEVPAVAPQTGANMLNSQNQINAMKDAATAAASSVVGQVSQVTNNVNNNTTIAAPIADPRNSESALRDTRIRAYATP